MACLLASLWKYYSNPASIRRSETNPIETFECGESSESSSPERVKQLG